MHDSNLKYKWGNKNVVDYARQEGIERGKHEEAITIAQENES